MKYLNLTFLAGWLLVLATLALMAFYAPLEAKGLRDNYLIFFFHFPSAITCLLFFGFAGIASIFQLGTGSEKANRLALAAVEVGILGCTITLVTVSLWAKAAWGVYWIWRDPRLMTVAIMWLTYLGYLALRSAIDSPAQRARFSAVFGIIAMINIPLVWFSIRIFRAVRHKMNVEFEPRIRVVMWFGALAFLILYLAIWHLRYRIARLRDEAGRLEEEFALREI